MAPAVNVQLPHRCAMSVKPMDVHRNRPPKWRTLSDRARLASRSSDGADRSRRRCSRRLITSAHLCRSACDIQSGTRSSRTPERSRAATVRRRFRVGTMRMGGGNGLAGLFKALCSGVAETGVGSDSKCAGLSWKPRLLSAVFWTRHYDCQRTVPRSLVIGNGNVCIGFDATYSVRDIYFPRVGDANQTMGNICHAGFFIDGKFAWLDGGGWERQLGYVEDSLVTDVTLKHVGLRVTHWVCMGARLSEVSAYGQDLIIGRGPNVYYGRTRTYWQVWSEKDHRHIDEELGAEVTQLYRRSILTARTHADNHGAIIAATDFDITKFARDTYAYAWPRDGALVANALDRSGHEDITRQFFTFCQDSLVEEGFFLHKYTPYGNPGSSWLPWVDARGARTLPIQEDETGLVLWALWQHYKIHRNLDFVVGLYTSLVVPAADWMVSYVDQRNGLIQPSWDLWEERWGVHAFTVGSVWGGLDAARSFAELFGDGPAASRYRDAAERLKEAADTHLYTSELGRFARRIAVEEDGTMTDAR